MSDDLVNQITLNFLISKQQLQKLNKKIRRNTARQDEVRKDKCNEKHLTVGDQFISSSVN